MNGDWSTLVDFAGFMSTWTDRVGHLLWATKPLLSADSAAGDRFSRAMQEVSSSLDTIDARIGQVGRVASIVDTITGALNTMVSLERLPVAGAPRHAAGLASLRVVCSFLPVLGEFYCEAIDAVSDVATEFARLIRNRRATLERVAQESYPRGLMGSNRSN
jgi:hypothetical protein